MTEANSLFFEILGTPFKLISSGDITCAQRVGIYKKSTNSFWTECANSSTLLLGYHICKSHM